jgi:hypothetical protein
MRLLGTRVGDTRTSMVTKSTKLELFTTTRRESGYLKGLSETSGPGLVSTMRTDYPKKAQAYTIIRVLGHPLPETQGLPYLSGGQNSGDDALLRAKAELFSTPRDRKCLLEVFESVPVFKDLHGQTVLRRDGGHVGSVLSPHKIGFIKPGKLRKKTRAGLLLLCITVL